jgi:hypothetical protein
LAGFVCAVAGPHTSDSAAATVATPTMNLKLRCLIGEIS